MGAAMGAARAQDGVAAARTPRGEGAGVTRGTVGPPLALAAKCRREDAADLVDFGEAAPYPIPDDSVVPGTGERFFSPDASGRLFHDAPRGGRLFEDQTYSDRRSLVVVPPGFDPDPAKRPVIVLFLHGNLATLRRDVVRRQRVPEQVERSGLNAVLVAPQLACDALDSSPGRFYEPGFLDAYLREAARRLAERSRGRFTAEDAARWPVILVAYSGGYLAAAYALSEPSEASRRVRGVVLLDALFGEEARFAAWIGRAHARAFFVSAYSPSSAALNGRLAIDLAGGPADHARAARRARGRRRRPPLRARCRA